MSQALIKSCHSDLVRSGHYFVSNPDLGRRVENGAPARSLPPCHVLHVRRQNATVMMKAKNTQYIPGSDGSRADTGIVGVHGSRSARGTSSLGCEVHRPLG